MMKPVPWTRQPQYSVGIDWDNPITRGIAFAFEASLGQRDIVTGAGEPSGAGVSPSVGQYGKQFNFSGSQANRSCSFGVHKGLMGATSMTLDVLVYFNGANPSTHMFGQWDHNPKWLLHINSGSIVWVAAQDDALNRRRFDSSGFYISAAGWYRIICSWRGGSDATMMVNRSVISTSQLSYTANTIGPSNTLDYLQLGITNGGAALSGCVAFARAWRRGLSIHEMRSLHGTPWQIFAPLERRRGSVGDPPQLLAPTGPATSTGWLSSTGGDLYTCVDEATADGADYVYTTTPGSVVEWTFPSGGAVSANGGFVRYQIPAGTGSVSVELRQGASLVQTLGTHTLTGSVQNIEVAITASTTDSVDLRVRFTGNA